MYEISKHAVKRLNDRGIRKEQILLFMENADCESSVGNGDTSYTLGRDTKKEMLLNGVPGDLVSKFSKLAVVITGGNIIKTCLYMNNKHGKRYRNRASIRRRGNVFKKLELEKSKNVSLFKELNNG
ncbi:DUF4258 domain-containing protein [Hyphomicrobiales bacterium]|nr:DUF4258 domain-containing protein [Hyphomicrobiales bacterium]